MKRLRILFLAALSVTLCACAAHEPRVEYNGERLSESDIFSLADRFSTETENESETETEPPEETQEPTDGIVHWTEGGLVWHEWLSCGHLSDEDEVKSGRVEDAAAAGKERGCAFCTDEQETKENSDK